MKLSYYLLFLGFMSVSCNGICSIEKTNSISRSAIEEMTQSTAPQENSPFFIEREEARQAAAEAATNSIYRSSLLVPRHSIQEEMKKWASQCLNVIKIIPNKTILPSSQIIVEPIFFSLSETPQLHVSFKVTNNTKKVLFLDFSTNQRLEILLKEQSGMVITRWSEDRSFDSIASVVIINPKESVVYTETIPTLGMKKGVPYNIEVSLVGHPEYTHTQSITSQDSSEDFSNASLHE
ncbi:MAG: hypothetical protein DVB29_03080 [Verrucomicrobia bacterium]|nr:MAG: hypothetical protein DVB29_03080 [Verrucomicrobiota bacterium]